MKRIISYSLFSIYATVSIAAVPLRWTVETSRVQTAVFDVVRGETVELVAEFQSYGKPLSMAGKTCSIFYQTNGMDKAWWTGSASVESNHYAHDGWYTGPVDPSNVVATVFTPAMDPGASVVNGFIGTTGDNYRAAFTLRFRKGPGALPNVITQPPAVLDLANTTVINAPWPTDETIDERIRTVIDEDNITANVPTNMVRETVSNIVTKAYVEGLGITSESVEVTHKADAEIIGSKSTGWITKFQSTGNQSGVLKISVYYDAGIATHYNVTMKMRSGDFTIEGGSKEETKSVTNPIGTGYSHSTSFITPLGRSSTDFISVSHGSSVLNVFANRDIIILFSGSIDISNTYRYLSVNESIENATNSLSFVKSETDPTVPAWAKAENPPEGMTSNSAVLTNGTLKTKSGTAITAAHVGAGSATDTQTALSFASGVYNYMNANTNAWFAGTNYVFGADAASRHKFTFEEGMNLATVPCSMSLYENRDGSKQLVWDQRDWTAWYWSFKAAQMRSEIAATNTAIYTAIGGRSPAAWATRTAATGLVNPDASTTWVDTDKVTLAPGMAWETVATVSGCAYWTIVGRNVQLGGSGTDSVFQIKDFEGNSVMKITKTASYLTYLEAGSDIYTSGRDSDGRVTFTMRTNVKPTAEFSTVLSEDTFIAEGEDGCPANYEWEQVSDGYCCHFILKPGIVSNACFARFKVEVQGSTTIEYEDGVTIKGGLIYNDVKIVPVIPSNAANGTTITWKVVR